MRYCPKSSTWRFRWPWHRDTFAGLARRCDKHLNAKTNGSADYERRKTHPVHRTQNALGSSQNGLPGCLYRSLSSSAFRATRPPLGATLRDWSSVLFLFGFSYNFNSIAEPPLRLSYWSKRKEPSLFWQATGLTERSYSERFEQKQPAGLKVRLSSAIQHLSTAQDCFPAPRPLCVCSCAVFSGGTWP
jgi:hypothetical protein